MNDTKLTNPKDHFGSAKIDLGLAPDTMEVMAAEAFLEGALKYGRYNWRVAGVRASIYYAALKRHMKKWWNGQDRDPKTGVHHLCNALACITILFDAEVYGKLEDDRPPCPDPDAMARLIDSMESSVSRLKEMFKDHKPKQYTIADTPKNYGTEAHPCYVPPPPPIRPPSRDRDLPEPLLCLCGYAVCRKCQHPS